MIIEAMKQALEALETLNSGDSYKTHNAASALRQAIEQAEKPWVKTYAGGKPNYTTPATPAHSNDISAECVDETAKRKHKPVAWHEPGAYGNVTTHKDWALANGWEPLYTKENTQDALAERKRIVDLLMIQHEAANGRHNYWKVAAELIQADVASDT